MNLQPLVCHYVTVVHSVYLHDNTRLPQSNHSHLCTDQAAQLEFSILPVYAADSGLIIIPVLHGLHFQLF